jgi:tetratricopeptide (TPR) repeat protein
VPVPLRKEDVSAFHSAKGVPVPILCENMARVVGIDPRFKHNEAYTKFMFRMMGRRYHEYFTKEGRKEGQRDMFDEALIHYRCALYIAPDDQTAMYGYARTCRALYNKEGMSPELIGAFKAEALEYFEMLTEMHPRLALGWYYLGYMYLNLGLYTKAYIAWESFLPKSHVAKDRKEVKQRMKQIQTPMEIERGCNAVMSGKWQDGIVILEPFSVSVYKDWWPLWYYLGVAYRNTGKRSEAKEALKTCLKLNGSHIETMKELAEMYEEDGDTANAEKYSKKIEIVSN